MLMTRLGIYEADREPHVDCLEQYERYFEEFAPSIQNRGASKLVLPGDCSDTGSHRVLMYGVWWTLVVWLFKWIYKNIIL
jgi:hypothetical protein